MGTSYRTISLVSVIADTGEKHYSLHNRKHTKHTHAARVQNTTLFSDGTTLSKQHRSKGVQTNGSFARTITVALDMSKAFDTINIRTLIRKLLQTKIPGGPTEGACLIAAPSIDTRPKTSALRMPSTHPAIRNANNR